MKSENEDHLYLDYFGHNEDCIYPLHTSISLFLLAYCECKIFRIFLVTSNEITSDLQQTEEILSKYPEISFIKRSEIPVMVQSCCLPAVVEKNGRFCRAGLAVVLRYIVQKTHEADPLNKGVLELLGFKRTCLKACAEVSEWTRLCEVSIPLAVENFLKVSHNLHENVPKEILLFENKLGEPVRVHNDDKIRRQKVQQQKMLDKTASTDMSSKEDRTMENKEPASADLELRTAFSKLTLQKMPLAANREPSHIRKIKTSELPPLEHIFAEGLYFTLTDIVLLPCIHHFLEKGIEAMFSPHPCPKWALDWDSLPGAVNPGKGKMSADRALRKQQQLNNLIALVTKLAKPGDVIVDFCSGGGHVGIVLAYILPLCQIILVENKEQSLICAEKRSDELGLHNIWFIQANMDNFKGSFNIGVALHACGVATDMVIEHCIKVGAAFVISPCCYGFVQNTSKFAFPKSHQFKKVLSYKEHMILCRFADQTAVQLPPERRQIGKQCMGLVDLDRAWSVERSNYSVQVITMEPQSCSPKNNLITGIPV
ncbi:glutathione S-transferase C-terminal domain-containing protein isoform X2 [Ahaetulla prasina]|uniref:glutathione S-transferase C-terminal domain-containing protein isoform X2 n=1 Tax=Ahaetulla prasina TaxID=499056 RepID=UPI002647BC63|nr:glutathione S-transferase C-terminal domain-containing protein isoform X2 [Ahaetulla prasina]